MARVKKRTRQSLRGHHMAVLTALRLGDELAEDALQVCLNQLAKRRPRNINHFLRGAHPEVRALMANALTRVR